MSGPVLNSAYSSAIAAFPNRLFARSFSVRVLLHFVLHSDLKMVVQIFADAGEIVDGSDAIGGEQRRRTNARKLQQLRRSDAAGRENRFTAPPARSIGHRVDGANSTPSARNARSHVDAHALDECVCDDRQSSAAKAPGAEMPWLRSTARRASGSSGSRRCRSCLRD